MSEANIALLKRAWAAYDKGDEEAFAACLTPDWKEYGSPNASSYGTLEDERRTMREHRIAFPDKHTEIHMILADENIVACFCTVPPRIAASIWMLNQPARLSLRMK